MNKFTLTYNVETEKPLIDVLNEGFAAISEVVTVDSYYYTTRDGSVDEEEPSYDITPVAEPNYALWLCVVVGAVILTFVAAAIGYAFGWHKTFQ